MNMLRMVSALALSGYRRLELQAATSLEFNCKPKWAKIKVGSVFVYDEAKSKTAAFSNN